MAAGLTTTAAHLGMEAVPVIGLLCYTANLAYNALTTFSNIHIVL